MVAMPASRGVPILAWIAASPGRAFGAFLTLHAALWTALPALLCPNLPPNLIEALVYGREWQLGYGKLPPLPWLLVDIMHRLIGHDFAYYLLAQVAVVAAFGVVFMMARPLLGALGALAAVLIVDGLHTFNYTAPKFEPDVMHLPFWALAGFALHRALRDGGIRHWLLLGVALAALLIVMAPHLVGLVSNDFSPFAYAEHRALQFFAGQLVLLIPSLLIAVPLFWPRRALDQKMIGRIVLIWAIVFAGLALAFIGNYGVLPNYDHRYRAEFFPGDELGRELSQRYRASTGQPLAYVIGGLWVGGNVEHYAPEQPRLLIDGRPSRAPWIDLNDLRARGAVVVWTDGDLNVMPPALRTIAADAAVQPPLTLPFRRGDQVLDVGWAILLPKPSYASAAP